MRSLAAFVLLLALGAGLSLADGSAALAASKGKGYGKTESREALYRRCRRLSYRINPSKTMRRRDREAQIERCIAAGGRL